MRLGSEKLRAEARLWHGNVPAGWAVRKFKQLATVREGQVDPEDERYRNLPLFAPNHIESGTGRILGIEAAIDQGAESGKYLVDSGDVLYSKIRPGLRKVALAPSAGLCSADMYPIKPGPELEARFLCYSMLGEGFFRYSVLESDRVAMPKINREALGDCVLLVPPRAEQRAIADFLDRKTAAINLLIAAKQGLADALLEKRQAVISQFVTKGCIPGASMRDSGVKWLGWIPDHWEVLPLRRVVDEFVDYRGRTPTKVDDGVPLITAGAVRDGTIDHRRAPEYIAREEYAELMRRGVPCKGDLVFTTEAPLGEVALVEDTTVAFAQRIILFRVNRRRMMSEYLRLYFLSAPGRADVESRASGSTAEGIRADRLRASIVLVPPILEQASIVEAVAKGIHGIESLHGRIRATIEMLKEYRQALITAAVSGQIDVSAQEAA